MADPKTSAVELDPNAVASEGEDVFLHVEADVKLVGPVKVKFSVVREKKEIASFEESLPAETAKPRDPASKKIASRLKWKVRLTDKDPRPDTAKPPAEITFTATDANGVVAMSEAPLLVRAIAVTTDKVCTDIMLHEFAEKKGSDFVFSDKVPQKFVDELSPQQRNLLLNYQLEAPNTEQRLVAFATFTKPDKRHLMGADFTDANFTQAKSNASFSLFLVKGKGKDVQLICHTEHFLLNFRNGYTNSFFNKLNNANELDKKNSKPKKYKICCGVPDQGNDDLVWSRVTTPTGEDIMPQNTMHGMINTIGCWMLFRNYNWPKDGYATMDEVYRKIFRPGAYFNDEEPEPDPKDKKEHAAWEEGKKMKAQCDAKLKTVGYDRTDKTATESSSYMKFWKYDMNFAYLDFFANFVGIKGWSHAFGDNPDSATAAHELRPALPFAHRAPNSVHRGYSSAFFDNKGRNQTEVEACKAKALPFWTETPYQKPKKTFADNEFSKNGIANRKKIVNIDAASWADIYFFKEDGAPVP